MALPRQQRQASLREQRPRTFKTAQKRSWNESIYDRCHKRIVSCEMVMNKAVNSDRNTNEDAAACGMLKAKNKVNAN